MNDSCLQGGWNISGTVSVLKSHSFSRANLNHLVQGILLCRSVLRNTMSCVRERFPFNLETVVHISHYTQHTRICNEFLQQNFGLRMKHLLPFLPGLILGKQWCIILVPRDVFSLLLSLVQQPNAGHKQWHTTVGRIPPAEWSARRRELYLTTLDKQLYYFQWMITTEHGECIHRLPLTLTYTITLHVKPVNCSLPSVFNEWTSVMVSASNKEV
jgi:hypothetical protein